MKDIENAKNDVYKCIHDGLKIKLLYEKHGLNIDIDDEVSTIPARLTYLGAYGQQSPKVDEVSGKVTLKILMLLKLRVLKNN